MADINKVKKIYGKDIAVDWENVLNKPDNIVTEKMLEEYAKTSEIPDVSNFITKSVNDLANYYLKTETYSQEQINNMVSMIPKFSIEVVDALPTSEINDTTIYLVTTGDEDTNIYTEYIYVNNEWEKLGTQTLDLSGYYTKEEVNNLLLNIDLSEYYTKIEIDDLYIKKVDGKDLSSNDFTDELKTKLDGIAENANNYTHPEMHPGSMIENFKNIYIQSEEPTNAPEGSIWIDTDEELGALPRAEEVGF